jgi:hypothetical protein
LAVPVKKYFRPVCSENAAGNGIITSRHVAAPCAG